jgi:hypothetical protein
MRNKTFLLVTTASLFVALPVLAQGNGNNNGEGQGKGEHQSNGHGHNPKGNGSDHTGPDTDGSGGKGDQDDKGNKDGKSDNAVTLKLVSPVAKKAVAVAAATVTHALAAGSFTTPSGVMIPAAAQTRAHDVMIAGATTSPASTELLGALAVAGPASDPALRALVRSMSGLASNPAQLPQAVADYNRFVNSAPASFLTRPPAEFVAVQAVLVKLIAAAGGK